MTVIVNGVLSVYLFQENKSYGSKRPFALILWCTRSRVEHRKAHVGVKVSDQSAARFHKHLLYIKCNSSITVPSGEPATLGGGFWDGGVKSSPSDNICHLFCASFLNAPV